MKIYFVGFKNEGLKKRKRNFNHVVYTHRANSDSF